MTGGFSEAHYAAEEDVRLGESAQKRFLVSESRHSKVLAECANPEELSLIQVRLDDPNPDSRSASARSRIRNVMRPWPPCVGFVAWPLANLKT